MKLRSSYWLLLPSAAYVLVMARSITFEYIEGDDATSIAYHLLGRRPQFQPVYAPYQMMMDRLLGLLPPAEQILRYTGFGLTAIFGLVVMLLMLLLAVEWIGRERLPSLWLVSAAVLLAMPALFYLGLGYSPTLIGFSLILAGYLLVRRQFRSVMEAAGTWIRAWMLGTACLFGLGVSFRWNLVTYAAVIFVDLFLLVRDRQGTRRAIGMALAWLALALAASAAMIVLSGFDFTNLQWLALVGVNPTAASSLPAANPAAAFKEAALQALLAISPLLTPTCGLLAVLGFYLLMRRRDRTWLVALTGMAAALPWIPTGEPKFIIAAIPGLMAAFIAGFAEVWQVHRGVRGHYVARGIVMILLLLPWLVGVQIARSDSAWGPAFELRPYDYAEQQSSGMQLRLGLDAGAAFPTSDGPRPLYGHAWALLGGKWRQLVTARAQERRDAIAAAIARGANLVVTNWSPDYFLDALYQMGYHTDDPLQTRTGDGYFQRRTFVKAGSETVVVLIHEVSPAVVGDLLRELSAAPGRSARLVLSGYPATMRRLYLQPGVSMQKLGTDTSLLSLPAAALP